MSDNSGYQTANVIQIRLDTSPIIENIEMFLRGSKIIVTEDQHGNLKTKKVNIGGSKANELGVQSILNSVQTIINPQVVQGNFDKDTLQQYLYRVHMDLCVDFMLNLYHWEIKEDDYEFIIDTIMNMIEPFMTRLLDNKERDSYGNTMKHIETRGADKANGMMTMFAQR